jgi:hypothetical protein
MNQIDDEYYCSGDFFFCGECSMTAGLKPSNRTPCFYTCKGDLRRRKWPTVKQFKAEYYEDYPPDGGIYWHDKNGWHTASYYHVLNGDIKADAVVCACTAWGKPVRNWRPQID